MKFNIISSGAFVVLSAGILMSSGCSTQPLPALEEARKDVEQLRNDPVVVENAPVALYEAEKILKKADRLWTSEEDEYEVEHLAYLTKGRVAIARYSAQRRVADDQIKELENTRKKLILEAREQEARLARVEAEEAKKRVQSLEEQLKELQAKKTDRGLVVTIGDVLFDTGKANLKAGALQNLYRLVLALKDYETRNVLIEGHTDSVGTDEYNLDLSQRRAQSVANFLLSNGIETTRIISRGYGETYPVSTNETAVGRQQNRRVEIVILNEGETPETFLRH